MYTQWDIVIRNTTPYTRCLLTPVSHWFAEHCVEVSLVCNATRVSKMTSRLEITTNLYLGYMLHEEKFDRVTEIKSAYDAGMSKDMPMSSWINDYHLMIRARPDLRQLSHSACVYGDIDVIEFIIPKFLINRTPTSCLAACVGVLAYRGFYNHVHAIMTQIWNKYSKSKFTRMFLDVMLFASTSMREQLRVDFGDNLCENTDIDQHVNVMGNCLRGVTPVGITVGTSIDAPNGTPADTSDPPKTLPHRAIHAAAYGGHISLLREIYRRDACLLTEIWKAFCYGLITEEIFVFALDNERDRIADIMIDGTGLTNDAHAVELALEYITDTSKLIADLSDFPRYISQILARHYAIGKPLTTQQHESAIIDACGKYTLEPILALLAHEHADASVYYRGIEHAAHQHMSFEIITRLASLVC